MEGRSPREVAGTVARVATGQALGAVHALLVAPLALLLTVLHAASRPLPAAHTTTWRWLTALARRFGALERRRRRLFLAEDLPAPPRTAESMVRFLLAQCSYTALTVAVVALTAYGLELASVFARGLITGTVTLWELVSTTALGGTLLFLALQGLLALYRADTQRAQDHFGGSEREHMLRRIIELQEGRAAVLAAVDSERRRIERDLHDGLQQRLIAAGLLVARAERTSSSPHPFLRQAADEIRHARQDLRDVAWHLYPAVLHQIGLEETLLAMVQRSPTPVRLHYDVGSPLGEELETAIYFSIAELVTNANKHAGARLVTVHVVQRTGMIDVMVSDNGRGGADPQGTGLRGIRNRVESVEGHFTLDSPHGGPTVARGEFPCAS